MIDSMGDWNLQDWKMTDEVAEEEIAGLENDGVEQEQTYCIRRKTFMCTTCNCFKHKSNDIHVYYTAFTVIWMIYY